MSDRYKFTVNTPGAITWTDEHGQQQTREFGAGESIEISDACEAYRFVRAGTQGTQRRGYRAENSTATLGSLRAACARRPTPETVVEQPADAPTPVEQAPPATPGDDTPGEPPSANPPTDVTTPDAVDAQPPVPDVQAQAPPVRPGVPDGRPVEQRATDPQNPLTDAAVAEEVDAGGLPGDGPERVRRNDPTPGLPHYHFGRNQVATPHTVGEPVDLATGDFLLDEADLAIPGLRRPLRLLRRYRSGVPFFGPWGFNWDHNYDAHVRRLDEGWVAVWTGLLNEDAWEPDAELGWKPPIGVTSRLVHEEATVADPERWTVRTADGTSHVFEHPPGWPRPERFPLVRVTDRFGNTETLAYDAEGRVATVRDDLGRGFTFTYGACGLLEAVADTAGRTVRYVHDEFREHLVTVVQPPTPEAPEGARTGYFYDDAESHPRLRHNVVRVQADDGCAVVENEYGKDPSSADFARVVEQAWDRHRSSYRATVLLTPPRLPDAVNAPATQVESVIDSTYKVLTFNFRGNLLEERYRLVVDGSWRLVVEVYRYDAHGNQVLHRRPNGLTLHETYDVANDDPAARGNLLERWLEAPPAKPAIGRRTHRMRYEPLYQRLHDFEDESGAVTRYVYGDQVAPNGVPALVRLELPDATSPDGTLQAAVEQYEYDALGRLLRETSPEGRVVEYRYGAAGDDDGYLVERVRDPGGIAATERFAYDAYGNVRAFTDGEGGTTTFEFDARNRLVRALQPPVGGTPPELLLTYHRDGLLATLRRPRGECVGLPAGEGSILTTYRYDVVGRVVEQVDGANSAAPRHRRFGYDAEDRVVETFDAIGRRESLGYDERGVLVSQERDLGAASRAVRYVRDLNGLALRTVLPGGATLDWAFDSWDRPRRQQEPADAAGRATLTHTYGDDDLLLSSVVEGPDGHGGAGVLASTGRTYDERGRVVTEDDGSGLVTTWHDADGHRTAVAGPSGATTRWTYDAVGRVAEMHDAAGNGHAFTYDRADRLVEHAVRETGAPPVTRTTRWTYDASGRVVTTTAPDGRTTTNTYDTAGNVVRVASAGGVLDLRHNAFGELVETTRVTPGGPETLSTERDGAGRPVALTDASGAVWRYEYDAFDALVRRTDPEGRTESWTYGTDGVLAERTTPGGSRFVYDTRPDGALVGVTVVEAAPALPVAPVTFGRDALGRAAVVTQGGATIRRRYDLAGRLVEEGAGGVTFRREYDDAARTELLTYSDARRDRLVFDELDRLSLVELAQRGAATATSGWANGTRIGQWRYAGEGLLEEREIVTGNRLEAEYDDARRLVSLAHHDRGRLLARLRYVRDAAGLRRACDATGDPWRDRVWEYDATGRLVAGHDGVALPSPLPDPRDEAAVDAYVAGLAPSGAAVSDTYVVSDTDSRLSWTRQASGSPPETVTYALHPDHRLDAVTQSAGPAVTVTHDPDLRRAGDGRLGYAHDALGRLRRVHDAASGAAVATLEWDGAGRLASVTTPGGTVGLRYLGDLLLERVLPGGAVAQRTYGSMPAEVPLEVGPGGAVGRLTDDRGSTMMLTDGSGRPATRLRFDDFGRLTAWNAAGTAPAAVPGLFGDVTFAGMAALPGSGLYVAGTRVYDAATGRFLQPDPEDLADSTDRWTYARHEPVGSVDAGGRYIESAWDVFSLGVGLASAFHNAREGNWWSLGLDVVGIVADMAALVLPGVPGGAGAAIRAARAVSTGAEAVSQVTRVGRTVRGVQAAVGVSDAVRGGVHAYESAREGNYGWAAAGVGLSAVGMRSSLSRLHLSTVGSDASRLYSTQGSVREITSSGRIWGETEGRVWATPFERGRWWQTGQIGGSTPVGERVLFEFQGEAARVFQPHAVWGVFSGWKAFAGQRVTALGDLRLDRYSQPVFDGTMMSYRSVVTAATHLPGDFAGRSAAWRWTRASWPVVFDTASNVTVASVPALLGAIDHEYGASSGLATSLVPASPQLASAHPPK